MLTINTVDKKNMYKVLEEFPMQIRDSLKLASGIKVEEEIDKIVVAGMGGSAIAGDILKAYLDQEIKMPIFVVRDYFLPEFVNKKTLVFIVSYSGNTEETISAYRDARKKCAKIIAISAGGKLHELCLSEKVDFVRIAANIQPRNAIAYLFFPILIILQNSRIIGNKLEDIKILIDSLSRGGFKEMGKDLADKLVDKIPLIYTSDRLKAVAIRWKSEFNENSKVQSFYNVFPELDHNEIVGYTNIKGNFYVIILKDDGDYIRIKKRMDITKAMIKKKGVYATEIGITGGSLLTRIFSAIYIGDWTSYYLALKYSTDPTPVDVIEELKSALKR